MTADSMVSNTTYLEMQKEATTDGEVGMPYTFSGYYKPNGWDYLILVIYTDGGSAGYAFDITSGTVLATIGSPSSYEIIPLANGWFRISVTYVLTGPDIWIDIVSAYDDTFTVSGTADGIYIWGVQLEQASAATEYIPTTSTAVTVTDLPTLTGFSTLSGTSSLTFSMSTPALLGTGLIAGGSSLTFGPTATIQGIAPISGNSGITFDAVGDLEGIGPGAMYGTSSLTFGTTGNLTATAALSGSSSLTFNVTHTPPATGGSGGSAGAAGAFLNMRYTLQLTQDAF
jgi:hypothetical protein